MVPSAKLDADGAPAEHTRSRTSISIAPSETATLSSGSNFARTSKTTLSEGPSEARPSSSFHVGSASGSRVPNVTVPEEHKNRTLVLCFDGTGDQ